MMPILIANTSEIETNPNKLGSPTDYFKLMKPRVMSLVVFTAFVGYFTAVPIESYKLNPFLALTTLTSFFCNLLRGSSQASSATN